MEKFSTIIDLSKQSNPSSLSGDGHHFENQVQTAFVILMLVDGFLPYLPNKMVTKIQLQAKHLGYNTDDIVVFTEDIIAFSFDIGHDNVGATLAVARIVTGRGKPYPYDRRINVKGKCYK